MRIIHGLSRRANQRSRHALERLGGETKLSLLSETDIFRDLGPLDMEEIERMTAMSTCARGRVFYTPGETGEVLFVLKRGRVDLYRISPDGKKLIVASLGPGTVFGEMSIVGQGMYEAFAEATDECTLCVMSRPDVEHLLMSKPQVALRFLELMANRLKEVESRLETVAFKGVPSRLAAELLRLAGQGNSVDGISHQGLAEAVGAYRETVTRALNDFRKEGFIEVDRLRVLILDRSVLEKLAEG